MSTATTNLQDHDKSQRLAIARQEAKVEYRKRRAVNFALNRAGDIVLLLLIIFALFPIFWMVITSFKSNSELLNNVMWPKEFRLKNYIDLWGTVNFGLFYSNSLIICLTTTVVATTFSTMAGYAMARFKFPGSSIFGTTVIGTQLIPGILLMLPLYLTFITFTRETGIPIVKTNGGLILLYTGFYIPLSLWIVRGFFAAIPPDLEEAAMIDGATRFGAFWRIALPLARPGILATAIYVFLTAWDELFFASVMQVNTVPIGIRTYVGQYANRFDLMMAASVMVTIPVAIIFFVLQKHMISGLTAGAVKG
jgi:multiple sugar transport system permease protein